MSKSTTTVDILEQRVFLSTPAVRFHYHRTKTIFEKTKQNMLHLPTMESTKYYPLMADVLADLPSFRLAEAEKQYPFLNVGLDFFGPFYIEHQNRELEKQYVCLFTCLVTRAVHLEVCQTLDTDSCLLAIRRFVSRRGYLELIISDNGSNFTSARKMLDLSKISVDNDFIKSQLQQ